MYAELGMVPDGRGVPAQARRQRFAAYSAGCNAAEEIHPYAVQVMDEVGIDMRDQYPKDLAQLMGRMPFGYVITVCARAERDCPTVFPGMGIKLSWLFDDPRGEELPQEERLEKFREIRDQIEQNIRHWLEHPEEEIAKLNAQRERERQERMRVARQEAESPNTLTEVSPTSRTNAVPTVVCSS